MFMEELLDNIWETIYGGIQSGAAVLDSLLSPLNVLGPVLVITLLAAVTVGITKVLKKTIRTKRLVVLEKDFQHWMSVREEAMNHPDRAQGKALARNIDQAKLNRAYYDYFLEGLLLSLVTFMLPMALMASYVNEYYRAERLLADFGREYIFRFNSEPPILVGSVFWFICSVLVINIVILVSGWLMKKKKNVSVSRSGTYAGKNNTSIVEESK